MKERRALIFMMAGLSAFCCLILACSKSSDNRLYGCNYIPEGTPMVKTMTNRLFAQQYFYDSSKLLIKVITDSALVSDTANYSYYTDSIIITHTSKPGRELLLLNSSGLWGNVVKTYDAFCFVTYYSDGLGMIPDHHYYEHIENDRLNYTQRKIFYGTIAGEGTMTFTYNYSEKGNTLGNRNFGTPYFGTSSHQLAKESVLTSYQMTNTGWGWVKDTFANSYEFDTRERVLRSTIINFNTFYLVPPLSQDTITTYYTYY